MPDAIYHIPDVWLFFIINGFMLAISFVGVFLIEKFIPVQLRYKENQATGYISATICLIFAVLAGFAALYVLNNFTKARESAQEEADRALAIYQEAQWLPNPLRSSLQIKIKNYLSNVVNQDWPLMSEGQEEHITSGFIINEIANEIHQSHYEKQGDIPFALQEISKEVILLRNAHEDRVNLKKSSLGPDIWLVLIITAFLTIAINYAFGMQFYLHFITVAAVSIAVSSMIFLLIVLDHPFQGEYSVGAHSFQQYLDVISRMEKGN